jgi:hypothetical protein
MRLAVNNLTELPTNLANAPKLAWIALSGNPLCPPPHPATHAIPEITSEDLTYGAKLGDGASGEVFKVEWQGQTCAMKQFKGGDASPDGQPCDEIAVKLFVEHPALTRVLARMHAPESLVMELVQGQPMAEKPNFESLLRCRWQPGRQFTVQCGPPCMLLPCVDSACVATHCKCDVNLGHLSCPIKCHCHMF